MNGYLEAIRWALRLFPAAAAVLTAAGKPALVFYDEANTSKYLLDANGAWSAQQGQDLMQTLLSK